MASISQTLFDNPVAEAELNHQQRIGSPQKWQRWTRIFRIVLVLGLLTSICVIFSRQIAALTGITFYDFDALLISWFSTFMILIGALIILHQIAFSNGALQLASISISREKQGRTWESLLLTGVDARRIVMGKWSATLHTLWRIYRPLLILRFAIAVWIGVSSSVARGIPNYGPPPLISTLLIGAVTAIFPLCYAAFTATLGLIASLLVTDQTAAHRLSMVFQFGLVVASISLILLSFTLPYSPIRPELASLIPALFVTPFDSGLMALIGIVAYNGSAWLFYLGGLLLCVAIYGALTWIVLRCAQMIVVRQNALPPI